MIYSTQSLTNSSPIKLISGVNKDTTKIIDQDSLYDKLNLILSTFYTQKQQYEQKVTAQKMLLQQRINDQSQTILQLQSKIQQLQQQTRQLRFNYHQRGAVVDYLKKKVIIIQKKFDSQKQQMLSVVKYLESRNSMLNQIIYQLKNKQAQLNQNIFQLQEKFVNMTNQYCNKNLGNDFCNKNATQKPKLNTKRTSISQKYDNSASYTPMSIQQIAKYQNVNSFSRQNLSNLFLEDLNNQSLAQSSIKEKTIKYQNSINRTRSQDQIDFAQLNHIISLGGTKQHKNTQIQQVPGKGILINNYGHLTFGDYQPQPRQSGLLTKQKKHYLSRPKLSLPNNVRYPTQLNTRRTNKETLTSHQL